MKNQLFLRKQLMKQVSNQSIHQRNIQIYEKLSKIQSSTTNISCINDAKMMIKIERQKGMPTIQMHRLPAKIKPVTSVGIIRQVDIKRIMSEQRQSRESSKDGRIPEQTPEEPIQFIKEGD
jgi:hypothetical protein